MNRLQVLLVAMVMACFSAGLAHADAASHEAAVKKLFSTMQMQKIMDTSITQMVDIQTQQDPAMARYRPVMMQFFNKHMSWEKLEPDMVKIYMESFTESEVNDLNTFYATPTGRKSIEVMPQLMSKGAAIGQRQVQQNIGELQQMIRDFDAGKK